jgi:hypothetical protein
MLRLKGKFLLLKIEEIIAQNIESKGKELLVIGKVGEHNNYIQFSFFL